jgi:hypothetical protein
MRIKVYFIYIVAVSIGISLHAQCKAQLTPQSVRQIDKLEQEKNNRTATEKKISSQLLQAIKASHGQNMADSVKLQPPNVGVDSSGNVKVDINATVSDSLLANIKRLGGVVNFSSTKFHSITATVNLDTVETIAAYAAVRFIKPAAIARTVKSP